MGNLYPLEVAKYRWSLLRTISNSKTEKMGLYILLYNPFLLSPLRFRLMMTRSSSSLFGACIGDWSIFVFPREV